MRICFTANGCAAEAVASTPATSCARRTEMFMQIGMEAFAERARRESSATGETARARNVDTWDELTSQEEAGRPTRARQAHQPGNRRDAVPQPLGA